MAKLLFFVASLVLLASGARADLLLQPNDRIALCGGGLPDNGAGVYFEDYLMMAAPDLRSVDTHQFTWVPGDLAANFNADVLPFKPSVVLVSTAYPGDPATHAESLTTLLDLLKKDGVRLIVVGSPPAVGSSGFGGDAAKADAENQKRAVEADIDKKVAAQEGAVYADVYGTLKAALDKAKALQGDNYVKQFGLADALQLAIAQAYLKALGFDGDFGALTIDFAAHAGHGTEGNQVGPLSPDHKFTVESTRFPFWFPAHSVGGNEPSSWPALQFLTFNQDLDRFTLTVKNLPSVQTKVYWGDWQQDFSSADLAKGVDLITVMPGSNPYAGTVSSVDNGVRAQQETDRVLGFAVNQGHPDPKAEAAHEEALKVLRDRCKPAQIKMQIVPLVSFPPQPPGPIPVILDTDLVGDVDDAGALALLNDFMDQGECNLLAVVHNTINSGKSSCGTIKAINDWYFHPDIPSGQYLGEHPTSPMTSKVGPAPAGPGAYHDPALASGSNYTSQVRQRFEPHFPDDDKMPAGVDIYRKALVSAPDGQVVICSIGEMENIQDLMLSEPDSVSPLSGMDLIKKKVRLMVNMANPTPADNWILTHWPKPILWTTYVGSYIGTGPSLIPTPENNPVRMCYDLFGVLHNGRQSWDLTAAWLAVRGPGNVFDVIAGRPESYISDITKTTPGPNEFTTTIKMPYSEVSKLIGDELARPPKK